MASEIKERTRSDYRPFSFPQRVARHLRVMAKIRRVETPDVPFLILFINSICNLSCEHCFYWRSLNSKDDLTYNELVSLSRDLGRVENLNLSGGEPFLRPDFGKICRLFVRQNRVRQIYVPTNGYFTDKTVEQIRLVLKEASLRLFVVEISLDGTPEYHNRFRGSPRSFQKAMETCAALAELQREDPRLRIHSISTVTSENSDEIETLSRYLFENCPAMEHHNIALIRGDRKNPALKAPELGRFEDLAARVADLWSAREKDRFGGMVEPLLQTAKVRTAREQRQVVPCLAGVLSGVIYANGDVAFCENHPPVGNLRTTSFPALWKSEGARCLRRSIGAGECSCTNEVFLWPSIVFQPFHLLKTFLMSRRPVRVSPDRVSAAPLSPAGSLTR